MHARSNHGHLLLLSLNPNTSRGPECNNLKACKSHTLPPRDLLDLVHVLAGVLVAHVGRGDVQLEVGAKVFKVVVVRELVGDLHSEGDRGLVRPAPRHVSDGVTTAAWKMD